MFDRPLRTKTEELEFCYGNALDEESDSYIPTGILSYSKEPKGKVSATGKKVKFDWIPQNVSDRLARMYLNQMPESTVPIAGSDGAHFRQQVNLSTKNYPLILAPRINSINNANKNLVNISFYLYRD